MTMKAEQFEFVIENPDERGAMPTLQWGRYTVVCTEWPGTLFSMLAADVLGPLAKAEAQVLKEGATTHGDPSRSGLRSPGALPLAPSEAPPIYL